MSVLEQAQKVMNTILKFNAKLHNSIILLALYIMCNCGKIGHLPAVQQ